MDNVNESSQGTNDDNAVKLKKFRKKLKWCRRNSRAGIREIVRLSDNPEMYQEEVRRYTQAKFGKLMNFRTASRLEQRQFYSKEYYPTWTDASRNAENSHIAELTDVALRYFVEGQDKKTDSGTLEARGNGFRYTDSSRSVQIEFSFMNVKHAFFRSEDEEMPLLLHFNLHEPINVAGSLEANDIQFQLVKIEKEKDCNEDFKKFVRKVEAKWNRHLLPFELPWKGNEFRGSSGVFCVTRFCLGGIVKAPFFAVALTEIEFVNLAHLRPGEIDVTIVLKDFTRDVFQINSVPSASFTVFKGWFDILGVKYYDNEVEYDWNGILNDIRENPQTFIEKGCWQAYSLETSAAAALSSDSYKSESEESESDFQEVESPWKLLMCSSTSDSSEEEGEA